MAAKPDVWLRGPVEGVAAELQPVAHALLQAVEDAERLCGDLTPEELWREVEGAASIGYHLKHIAGATDRLFTYARGEELSEAQKAVVSVEKEKGENPPHAGELIARVRRAVETALGQLRSTPAGSVCDLREVGRAKLPSSVIGLLFHAAEHAQRHCGQIATTRKFLRD
jgi:uncharacterized damage-inducible protein DinB